ncbi:hypothetical protein DFH11DRAFT_1856781 [Phellopilus nigrolimitatus]|nr:hypothetical protein DFH11DRAFT_1856781 [Phellopilus nigrolimitatus]
MSPAQYERLPSYPSPAGQEYSTTSLDIAEEELNTGRSPAHRVAFIHEPRFDLPTPPRWQRAGLLLFVVFLFWVGYKLRGSPSEEGIPAIVE